MLKCCKQDPSTTNQYQRNQQKPTHKYSFRHNANVLTNSLLSESQAFHYQNSQFNSGVNQEAQLQLEIQKLMKKQHEYNQFLVRNVNPLEREISFYEKQVEMRTREISQLQELLDRVIRQRNMKGVDLRRVGGL